MSIHRSIRGRIATLLGLWAAVAGGCEETRSVGSGCPNGVCPQALTRDDDACEVTVTHAELAIMSAPGQLTLATICLPSRHERRDDGTIHARVYYFLTEEADPAIGCTDRPFLSPVSAAIREEYAGRYPGAEMCELNQLAVFAVDGGAPRAAAGDGFFYDDFTELSALECSAPHARISITEAAMPWDGVVALMHAVETRDGGGGLDPTLACEAHQGTSPVGTPCTLTRTDLDASELTIATRVDACGDGLCLAYHLGGDIDPSCDASAPSADCAPQDQIDSRLYCTCRCDGPPGAELCECPEGFYCIDSVPTLEPGVAGGYCVKGSLQSQ